MIQPGRKCPYFEMIYGEQRFDELCHHPHNTEKPSKEEVELPDCTVMGDVTRCRFWRRLWEELG